MKELVSGADAYALRSSIVLVGMYFGGVNITLILAGTICTIIDEEYELPP